MAYLWKAGGTRSLLLNEIAQRIFRWSELHRVTLASQFIPGCRNVLADSVSSSPDPGLRVDPSRRHVSGPLPSVAGDGRFVCHLSKSPLFCLFLSLPGSLVCGDGRVSTVVGRSSSFRLPSLVCHSPGPVEASRFSGDLSDSGGSVLASAPVVFRAPRSGGCSSGGAAVPPGSFVPTSVGSPLSGSPQASSSCMETLRRFTRAAGFSSGVASQVSLARRTSSRTNYQLKWSTYRSWCRAKGHSISRPSLSLRLRTSSSGFAAVRDRVFLLLWVTDPCCRLCSVSNFLVCPLILF